MYSFYFPKVSTVSSETAKRVVPIDESLALLVFVALASLATLARSGRLWPCTRMLLCIGSHLEGQVVKIGEEARAHVFVVARNHESMRLLLVGHLEHD